MASNGSAELTMMVVEMSGKGEQARVPVIRGQSRVEREGREGKGGTGGLYPPADTLL